MGLQSITTEKLVEELTMRLNAEHSDGSEYIGTSINVSDKREGFIILGGEYQETRNFEVENIDDVAPKDTENESVPDEDQPAKVHMSNIVTHLTGKGPATILIVKNNA